jgi:hypothetical protein
VRQGRTTAEPHFLRDFTLRGTLKKVTLERDIGGCAWGR